jgi:hypothetical protein
LICETSLPQEWHVFFWAGIVMMAPSLGDLTRIQGVFHYIRR